MTEAIDRSRHIMAKVHITVCKIQFPPHICLKSYPCLALNHLQVMLSVIIYHQSHPVLGKSVYLKLFHVYTLNRKSPTRFAEEFRFNYKATGFANVLVRIYQGDSVYLLFPLQIQMDHNLPCLLGNLLCFYQLCSFVNTRKFCGFAKAKGFNISL